jgi:hypothetical protein
VNVHIGLIALASIATARAVFEGNVMVVRLQVELDREKNEELEAMMREGNVRTKKDLINSALTLLKWAMNERKEGRIIASVDEEKDTYKQLVMPILEVVKPQVRVARG